MAACLLGKNGDYFLYIGPISTHLPGNKETISCIWALSTFTPHLILPSHIFPQVTTILDFLISC